MTTRAAITLATVVLSLAHVVPAKAEVVGPLFPKGAVEIAVQDRYVERTQEFIGGGKRILDQRDLALVFRWGITEFATVSLEGMTGTSSLVSGYDDLQQFYIVGGGAQATLWRNDRVSVTGGLQYTETFRRWKDPTRCDEGTYAMCWQVLGQTDFRVESQTVTVFGGPLYSDDDLWVLEGVQCPRIEMDSDPNWGALIGTTVLLGGHVAINGQVFWVENPQPRFGIGYRF